MRAVPKKRGFSRTTSEDPSHSRRSLLQAMKSISMKVIRGLESKAGVVEEDALPARQGRRKYLLPIAG